MDYSRNSARDDRRQRTLLVVALVNLELVWDRPGGNGGPGNLRGKFLWAAVDAERMGRRLVGQSMEQTDTFLQDCDDGDCSEPGSLKTTPSTNDGVNYSNDCYYCCDDSHCFATTSWAT